MSNSIIYSGHVYEARLPDPSAKLINMYEDDEDGSFINSINAAESNHGTFVITPSKDPVANAVQILKAAKVVPYNNSEFTSLKGLWYLGKDELGNGTVYGIFDGWTSSELDHIKELVG
jgi:hypothetical protein